MRWDKSVHVRGQYLDKTAWYETGKMICLHVMTKFPGQILTAHIYTNT